MKKTISLLLILLLTFVNLDASEYNDKSCTNTDISYNNKMTVGTSINYWISTGNEYTNSIPSAVNKLMYPPSSVGTNDLVLKQTTNNQSSKLDFYETYQANTVNAYTKSYRKNSSGNYYNMATSEKDKYDWVYSEIYINDYNMSKYSSDQRSGIILHEMLHAYGLKDVNNKNSIMYCYSPGNPTTMTKDAKNVINQKY